MNAINTLHQFTKVPSPDSLQNILIVDDEQRFRFAYSNLLAHEQRSIEEASTGQEAIAKLRDGLIDLVILDMKLPDISGVEIMEWLATEEIDTLVIVFSADRSINAAIHALRYRAFEFLRKDCDPDEMVLAVERALSERQRKKEHAIINARLKHSERLHRFLVEQSPDLIFTLSQDGLFTFINARVHSLLGFLPEELIGKHYPLHLGQ